MFLENGASPTSGNRIEKNRFVGTKHSRSLLIFANGASDNSVSKSISIGSSEKAPIISISNRSMKAIVANAVGHYMVPATFEGNRYSYSRKVAAFDDSNQIMDFEAWNDGVTPF